MRLLAIIMVMILGIQANLHAGNTSFRCKGNLISLGDTMHEVRGACGEPYSKQAVGEKKTYEIIEREQLRIESITYLTEWIYQGGNGFYILTFEGSRLGKKEFVHRR